ncbi:molybdopterin/thiamine biosynthesis adenylyltransferase [Acetoanaerobium pronyense]|uniref:Molybdopterin/thiamine biosynthesis adenylyltransferase n=1 Tax=Acetoanaerobium pronyense TaxID=1482736 RepID=A0ABS4KM18_9FIRM|nr:HesA/MoeB/ThiF family protein [Acetoanaerobium pronyense]MBP2028833.1 molybdopterin/thiamine biosynthesis adenylyltransferase [Acetoanaerobium pronyense]
MEVEERYKKNIGTITEAEQQSLKTKKVFVAGLGGLGGYICEMLARMGVGHIKAIDCDVFEESNLNRQILCTETCIGSSKAQEAQKRLKEINSTISLDIKKERLEETSARELIKDFDIVVDALDSIDTRLILASAAKDMNIKMVHGAICGWYGQVSVIFPEDNTLKRIYGDKKGKGKEESIGNPPFTPALVASLEVAEAVKILIGRESSLRNKILLIDTLLQDYEVVDI